MATISSTLKLYDSFSDPLRHITQALNITISTMEKMQSTAERNGNIGKSLETARRKITSVETDIQNALEGARKQQEDFNKLLDTGTQSANSLLESIKGFVLAYAGIETIRNLGSAAIGGAMEQLKLRDMLIARTKNVELGTSMFEQFKKEAVRVGADISEYLNGTLGNLSVTSDIGQLKQLNMLAKQLSAFDTSGQGIQGAFFSLKEALSGDIVSLSERFNMSKDLIRQFKVDKLGKSGNLNEFITQFNKLLEFQHMGKESFERMLDSPVKKWEILLNRTKSMFADAGEGAVQAIVPLINTLNSAFEQEKFQGFFTFFNKGLAGFAWFLSYIANGAMRTWDIFVQYWPQILHFIGILSLSAIPFLTKQLWAMLVPLGEAIAKWWLAYWPIAMVATAVAILIITLRQYGVTTEEIIGFTTGLFYSLFTFIHNHVGLLWNAILSFAEFFVNVFIDPVYAVQKLFYDLAIVFNTYMYNMSRSAEDFAGNFMKSILKAINKTLEGFNWLVEKMNEMFGTDFTGAKLFDEGNIHAVSDSIREMMDRIEKPTTSRDVIDLSKYRMVSNTLSSSFGDGYYKGYNLTAQATHPFNPNVNGAINKINRVDEVGKIKNKVDISNEDLKMMRELAEMKNIQNFVTLTPTVQVQTGDINKGADIDTVVAEITKKLQTDVANSAKGVYNHA
ncbi:hypothetical protein [Brevibacillus laterosporus]|uniref:hypothetical protein n=1 Tax=Brevibacillus laterosporus TaxID=1465 RepID=UPI000EAFF84A|nr:hypothetical protein [Brevibacillus laterosporus]AYK05291.1 hypothetical protein D8Z77_02030 [Brevibacillus laterosporus]